MMGAALKTYVALSPAGPEQGHDSAPPCVALLSETLDLQYLVPAFRRHCPDIDLRFGATLGDLADIEAAVCWYPPHGALAQLPRLRLAQSVGAGVDHIMADPDLPPHLPVCRIVDPQMAAGMRAYVAWAVIQQQRGLGRCLDNAAVQRWEDVPVVAPGSHCVGIAGLGTLGLACAEALRAIGYQVRGWSRHPRPETPAGVTAYHGPGQLDSFLAGCDTLVCLLPLTPQTRGFLCMETFARLPRGAHLVNVGRGEHLVEGDLLAALATGQLASATLDAFAQEPLAAGHPFWTHPGIVVTPHIATRTDIAVIAQQTLDNLALLRRGLHPPNLVDRQRAY
jgi:glyoxylate/hydroxypyruvate reductase A